jgi:hypothetical protein
VDTIVRPPETGQERVASAPRRRRWPWIRLIALLGIALLAGSIWVANHVPLAQGSFAFGTLRPDVRETDVDSFDITGIVFAVPTGREARFRYRFSIRNTGPVGVTIERIEASDRESASGLDRRAVRVDPEPYVGSPDALDPWHPFSLAPGDEAVVEMEATYEGMCMRRGDAVSWNREPVTFSVLGLTRHEDVMVGVEVRFVGTGDCT